MSFHFLSCTVLQYESMTATGVAVRALRVPLVTLRGRLFLALIALNLLDVVTTQVGLAHGAVERNPLMVGAVETVVGALAAKVACLLLALAIVVTAPRSRLVDAGLAFCVCWYVGVVCWNLRVIDLMVTS